MEQLFSFDSGDDVFMTVDDRFNELLAVLEPFFNELNNRQMQRETVDPPWEKWCIYGRS